MFVPKVRTKLDVTLVGLLYNKRLVTSIIIDYLMFR